MKPVAYLVTMPPGIIPNQAVLVDQFRAHDYAVLHNGQVEPLMKLCDMQAMRQVARRQAVLLGELSKGLPPDDPVWHELEDLGKLIDQFPNEVT